MQPNGLKYYCLKCFRHQDDKIGGGSFLHGQQALLGFIRADQAGVDERREREALYRFKSFHDMTFLQFVLLYGIAFCGKYT